MGKPEPLQSQRGLVWWRFPMAEDAWQPARLIPTSGITGPDEQETRATSALLAQLSKSGSAVAAAGIDTTVLPEEQLPGEQLPESQLGDSAADENYDTDEETPGAPGDDPAAMPLEPALEPELVSWDAHEAHVVQERTEGLAPTSDIAT
jgi:hypothetical protein